MWSREESGSVSGTMAQPAAIPAASERRAKEEIRLANIGSSVFVKGELTASEDLMVDGRVEGRIDLPDHALTIGPNANIQADIVAKIVTVFGSVVGGIAARDKVDIRRGGSLNGDLSCACIAIHDGAHFCGKVAMGTRKPRSSPSHVETADASPALVAAL
jgi:cytoskeletal protein CcmA (bactofilin family)